MRERVLFFFVGMYVYSRKESYHGYPGLSYDLSSMGSSDLHSAIVEHAASGTRNLSVYSTGMTRSGFTTIGSARLPPLTCTNVCGPKPLLADVTRILLAYWEALFRAQKTLAATITLHDGALMTLWGLFCPAGPRYMSYGFM